MITSCEKIESNIPYEVDVPVLFWLWIRPHLTERVFAQICKEKPSILFIASDAGRTDSEKECVEKCRSLVKNIDWQCTVYRIYNDQANLGLYQMDAYAKKYVFNRVDRMVVLEDDVLPCDGFFRFCAELLEKYKDDMRVQLICGMNQLGEYKAPNSDYFFSNGGSIWGFAIWKRTYLAQYEKELYNNKYYFDMVKKAAKRDIYRAEHIFDRIKLGDPSIHPEGTETYTVVQRYSQNQLNIVATRNMITYLGFTDDAEHAIGEDLLPPQLQQLAHLPVFPFYGNMRHNPYVIRDIDYEKAINRIMGFGSWWNRLHIKLSYPLYRYIGKIRRLFVRDSH